MSDVQLICAFWLNFIGLGAAAAVFWGIFALWWHSI